MGRLLPLLLVVLLASARPARGADLLGPMDVFRLGNGLKVVLLPDHTVPKIAVVTYLFVGSRDEEPGRTGFAHLFEHLMFKGTPAIPDGRMDAILEEGGGFSTAFTNSDTTVYQEWAASSYLETALWIEADRLATLLDAFDEKKLANQRDVVRNERRQGIDNQPYGEAGRTIGELLWPEGHGYHWPTIGSHEDLVAASVDDVKRFFRRFYVPANMTMVVAGDFDPARARELVIQYAGRIPRAAAPVRKEYPDPPPLTAALRRDLTDDVLVPRVYLAWRAPRAQHADEAAAAVAALILGSGKSSRLYERLVYRDRLAQDALAYFSEAGAGGELQLIATAKPGTAPASLEAAMLAELARLASDGPTAAELERALNQHEAQILRDLESIQGKAVSVALYDGTTGDPGYLPKDLARFRAVTVADVKRVAAAWFKPDNRVTVTVLPAKAVAQ